MKFVDLVVLAEYMKGASRKIPNITVWGLIKGSISVPNGVKQEAIPVDCFCADIELFACRFDRENMSRNASASGSNLISKLDEYHYLNGHITAIIPKAWYGKVQPVELRGNLYRQYQRNALFYMTRWKMNPDKSFEISYCETASWEYMSIPTEYHGENIKELFEKSIQDKSIVHSISKPEKIMEVGVEVKDIRRPVVAENIENAGNTNIKIHNGDLGIGSIGLPEEISDRAVNAQKEIERESQVIRNKSYNKNTYREKYKKFEELKENMDTAKRLKDEFIEDNKASEVRMTRYIEYMADNIIERWGTKPKTSTGYTGKTLLNIAVTKVLKGVMSKSEINKMVKQWGIKVTEAWKTGNTDSIYDEDIANVVKEFIVTTPINLYFAVVETVLKLRCNLVKYVEEMKFTMGDLLENPYMLGIVCPEVSINDLDKLAIVFGNLTKHLETRNIAYLHHELVSNSTNGSTTFEKADILRKVTFGFELSNKDYAMMRTQNGCWVTYDIYYNIQAYINRIFGLQNVEIGNDMYWRQRGNKYIYEVNTSKAECINDYINSGMGIEYEVNGVKYVSDTKIFNQEISLYEIVYKKLSHKKDKLDTDKIEKCIEKFESIKSEELGIEFKLEDRQRQAAYTINNYISAISGKAGAGKTTTEELIIYCLKEYYSLDDNNFKLAAPSGLAANRMKECTKMRASTIHRMSKLEYSGEAYSDEMIEAEVIILDEMSMVSTDLMYKCFKKIKDDTKVLLIGDIQQLPAIGYGKPFADLLDAIPCVELNVSKRAAESSTITRDSDEIVTQSYSDKVEDVHEGNDVKIINVSSENISKTGEYIESIVRYHIGEKNELEIGAIKSLGVIDKNRIQVVTPMKKKGVMFASIELNKRLQDVMNPYTIGNKVLKIMDSNLTEVYNEYRVGDRVVHTSNMNDITRYTRKDGKYTNIGKGIYNGAIGYIHDIVRKKDIKIKGVDKSGDNDEGYVIVEYKDYADETEYDKFFIMYEFEISAENNSVYKSVGDIGVIELAYALTTHKMQGNEGDLVIAVVYNCGGPTFMNRNMVYTMMSRAKKGLYLVGSIRGQMSALNKARKIDGLIDRKTILGNIVGLENLHIESEDDYVVKEEA